MNTAGKAIAASGIVLGALGVRTYVVDSIRIAPAQSTEALALAHMDHSPRHGGLVLMNGDTHFEVVLDRTVGGYSVYFTDAVRAPLPASIASMVSLAVTQTGHPTETIPMQIDASGGRWVGRGSAIDDPNAIVRVTYSADDKPYWIDVPVSGWPGVTALPAS